MFIKILNNYASVPNVTYTFLSETALPIVWGPREIFLEEAFIIIP